jgi:general secretion pathway protein H
MRVNPGLPRQANGFSLFELLVVLLIVAVVLGLTAGFLTGSLSKADGKAAARRLAASLRYARAQAVAQGRASPVILDLESHSYAAGEGLNAVALPEGWRFHKVGGILTDHSKEKRILFYPDGSSSGGDIHLAGKTMQIHVRVDPLLGEVTVAGE